MIKNLYNKYKIFIAIGLLIIIILLLVFMKTGTDGMSNKGIYKVKYKVYQNGKWTKYSRNGLTAGDKEHPIENIEFKYKIKDGKIKYDIYDFTWYGYSEKIDNVKDATGVSIIASDLLGKKYSICYRTYNKKDKWLNWSCDGEYNGNAKENMTAIEIKMIPKNSIKFDYLKDFNKTLESSKNF